MRYTKGSLAVISVTVAGLLGLLWTWLPPLQEADIVGIVATVTAHIIVTLVADWLLHSRRSLYTTVGIGMTAVLYWLATVGVAVAWRLLLLVDSVVLAAIELVLVAVFAVLGWLFELAGRRMEAEKRDAEGLD